MGHIRCIAVSDCYLAVAGSLGNIMVIDRHTSICDFYNLGGSHGAITALTISPNDEVMAVGSEKGCINCFDMNKHVLIKGFDDSHNCRIVAL
jgi:hypothetical protein